MATVSPSGPDAHRYGELHWNTPLSLTHAALLGERMDLDDGMTLLDLGCGWGELLTRLVVQAGPSATGVGVDTDGGLLERGSRAAAERGLGERVRFVNAPASEWTEPADRVLCIGAAHAWGATLEALDALGEYVAPGGRVLFGDGCWEHQPTAAARAVFGEAIRPLSEVVAHASDRGWRVLHLSTADQREWDDFESGWRRGRELWLAANPEAPEAPSVWAELTERLTEYVSAYRGVLGFAYLVLSR